MNGLKKLNIGQERLLSTSELKELFKQKNQGDKQAKDKLVRHNLRLVMKIAHRFKNSQHDLEEIFQVGTLGLIRAVERFDLSRNVKFSTYAVPVIIGKIKSFLRDDDQMKVGRSVKQKANRIKKRKEELKKELKREPTIQELGSALDISCNEIVSTLEAVQAPTSIYKQVYKNEDGSLELIDQLAGENNEYNKKVNMLTLAQTLEKLTSRAKRIIRLRYFADKSQTEVAKLIGVSQAHISRLEKNILKSIKNKIETKK